MSSPANVFVIWVSTINISETLNKKILQVHRNNPFKSIVSLTFAQAIGLFITRNHFVLHNPKTKKLPY